MFAFYLKYPLHCLIQCNIKPSSDSSIEPYMIVAHFGWPLCMEYLLSIPKIKRKIIIAYPLSK